MFSTNMLGLKSDKVRITKNISCKGYTDTSDLDPKKDFIPLKAEV